MSLNAAALKLMADKGLSAHDIAEIAAATEEYAQSSAAIRQARYRERGGGKIPAEMRSAVFERDGWECLDCGSAEYLQCDHIIPVSKGGETSLDNLQTLCRPCNAKKKDRIRKRDRSRVLGNSTGNSSGKSADPAPNERDNLTPTREEKPKPIGLVKKPDKGFRLPADWLPQTLTGKAATMVAAWQAGAMERELAKFKNYWLAKGANAARTDWQRTWVNWLISADERKPRGTYERSNANPTAEAVNRILSHG